MLPSGVREETSTICPMGYTIRHAADHEHDIVASLIVDAYAEFAASMSPDAWSMFAQDIANVHGRLSDGEIIVAEDDDGAIVGTVTLYRDWRGSQPDTLTLRLLAVPPTHRNAGVGSELMEWAVAEARRDGKSRVVMTAMQAMDAMRDIATRFGFERAPALDHEPAPGVRVDGYSLELAGPGGTA